MEDSCADCIHSRMYEADPALQELPVFKCHRYPPTILIDANGETAQAFPDAWMSCGEFKPAEKTAHVVGRSTIERIHHVLDVFRRTLHRDSIRRDADSESYHATD